MKTLKLSQFKYITFSLDYWRYDFENKDISLKRNKTYISFFLNILLALFYNETLDINIEQYFFILK